MRTVLLALSVSVAKQLGKQMNLCKWLLRVLLVFGLTPESGAVISFSTGSYSQNFNTLATSGTGNAWANDDAPTPTLAGWSLFHHTGGAITTYNSGDGGSTTGNFYSFGTGTGTDRALGGVGSGNTYFGSPAPGSGALAGYIAVALQNTSGSAYNSFTISFTGEQWRNGGNATVQKMVLEYGFGATFATVSSWSPGGAGFDFSSLVNTASTGALDGNASANRTTGLGGTISSTWENGDTLWVRWMENNDVGNDHGLAIDDFSITAAAVPEPAEWGVISSLGLLAIFALRTYRERRDSIGAN